MSLGLFDLLWEDIPLFIPEIFYYEFISCDDAIPTWEFAKLALSFAKSVDIWESFCYYYYYKFYESYADWRIRLISLDLVRLLLEYNPKL